MTCARLRMCTAIALIATSCTAAPDDEIGRVEMISPVEEPTELLRVTIGRPEIDIVVLDPALAPYSEVVESAVQARACDHEARPGCLTSPAVHWLPDDLDQVAVGAGALLVVGPPEAAVTEDVPGAITFSMRPGWTGDPAGELVRAADWAASMYPGARGGWHEIALVDADGRVHAPVPCPDDPWMPSSWGPGDVVCWEVPADIDSWNVIADGMLVGASDD